MSLSGNHLGNIGVLLDRVCSQPMSLPIMSCTLAICFFNAFLWMESLTTDVRSFVLAKLIASYLSTRPCGVDERLQTAWVKYTSAVLPTCQCKNAGCDGGRKCTSRQMCVATDVVLPMRKFKRIGPPTTPCRSTSFSEHRALHPWPVPSALDRNKNI